MGLLHWEAFPTLRAFLEKIKEVVILLKRVINLRIRTNYNSCCWDPVIVNFIGLLGN